MGKDPYRSCRSFPAELQMGRRLRNHLSLLHPDSNTRPVLQRDKIKKQHAQGCSFTVGEEVYIRSFNESLSKWIPAVVEEKRGLVSYKLSTDRGLVRRHVDHVRRRDSHQPYKEMSQESDEDWPLRLALRENTSGGTGRAPPSISEPPQSHHTPTLRRSSRYRRPIDRFTPGPSH